MPVMREQSSLLENLNPAQSAAVQAVASPQLILAGAGSGKTRVLTHRAAWLIERMGVLPQQILAVTFTNKAAQNMTERLQRLVPTGLMGLWVGTFHGLANRILRANSHQAGLPAGFQILDTDDQVRLIKQVIEAGKIDSATCPPKDVAAWIGGLKDRGVRPNNAPSENPQDILYRQIYFEYQARCDRAGLLDFAELLLRCLELLERDTEVREHYQKRFSHLLVDEFQDTNAVQYRWLKLLAGSAGVIFAVGDDDQSIYGWRGARIGNMQDFLRDYNISKPIKLEQNYRSTPTILAVANSLISKNTGRLGKTLWAEGELSGTVAVHHSRSDLDEADVVMKAIKLRHKEGLAWRDAAILYRSNAQSRTFEEAFIRDGVPYHIHGGVRFFERAEVKDAMAYLRLSENPDDDAAFDRAINTPPRGLGSKTLELIRDRARKVEIGYLAAAEALLDEGAFSGKTMAALKNFTAFIHEERETRDLELRIRGAVHKTGLHAHHSKTHKGEENLRSENLDAMIAVGARFSPRVPQGEDGMDEVLAFLAQAALESGETHRNDNLDAVQMMTLHSAKGLEFPFVALVGLEEGLFPGVRAIGDPKQLEEERRLAYVGITRAKSHLLITHAKERWLYGSPRTAEPSRFLAELPEERLRRTASYGIDGTTGVTSPKSGRDAFAPGGLITHRNFGKGVIVGRVSGSQDKVRAAFSGRGIQVVAISALSHLAG
jgi:DNA helicase-2/ATP-dependent DNA helicase PcrA